MFVRKFAKVIMALVIIGSLVSVGHALSKEDVYYGKPRRFKKAAEVNAKKVFMAIPAYREIIDKNIEKDSARYVMKLEEANKVFHEAISRYAEENEYDLVCEEGRLEGAHNATDEVVEIIKADTGQ